MKVKEIDGKLICQKYDHYQVISMIVIDDNTPIEDILLCFKCLQLNRSAIKIIGIDQVRDLIKEKFIQIQEESQRKRGKDLVILKEFQQKMKQLEYKILKNFEAALGITQQRINEFEKNENDTQLMNLIRGLELLNQRNPSKAENNHFQINRSYLLKISQNFKNILSIKDLNQFYKLLEYKNVKQLQLDSLKVDKNHNEIEISNKNIKVQLASVSKQQEYCQAIAFNYNDSILVAGSDKNIQVYKFNSGNLKEYQKLLGHTDEVNCIVFSKKFNWFCSGSCDNTIRCWKQQKNDEFESSNVGLGHTNLIMCLILNNQENQLISCGNDCCIILWNVDYFNNQIKYDYTLEQKHSHQINCISLNETELYLVSCGEDKKIILWLKDNENKFKYQNEIVNDDFGNRLCFISDYQIIWQQQGKAIAFVFGIQNSLLIKKPEQTLQLNPNQKSNDHSFFPIIFKQKKSIILQSHNRYENGIHLKSDPIDCQEFRNYGTLSNDGNYFVVWILNKMKELQVYCIIDD